MADEPPVAGLRVYPEAVSLTDARDQQRLLVLQQNPDGSTVDITAAAEFSVDVDGLVRIESGVVRPETDGSGRIRVVAAGLTSEIPLQVLHAAVVPDLNFRSEVLATLTRAGCISGKCHGSASGKDGFRLSLFGYDPAGDQYRLTREIPGRRVNPDSPADSLLIRKALGEVHHTGASVLRRARSLSGHC